MPFKDDLEKAVLHFFALQPSIEQKILIDKMLDFYTNQDYHQLMIVKGYAGTGKTSLLSAFVQSLTFLKRKTVLLAPTGRAAKVFANKSKKLALTIHKKIYRKETVAGGGIQLKVAPNLHTNTLFLIDEASMIGDITQSNDGAISSRSLLEDVIEYVYSGKNCKLIFIGDNAQLPPVGSDFSPALSKDYLFQYFPKLNISEYQLTEVLRQATDSDILLNATQLRSSEEGSFPSFNLRGKNDVIRLDGTELFDVLDDAFNGKYSEEAIVITRSNKRANIFNQQIRARIFWYDERICSGDKLMIVKNNYFWLDDKSKAGFLANGEMIEVERIFNQETIYGFDFCDARIRLLDYPEMESIEVKLLLDVLEAETPNLSREKLKALFFEIEKDYLFEKNKRKRYERIMADPYFNAIQVKFAYAITCHKSQGGQWGKVFIDQGYLTEELLDQNFFRWLYTAFTRATTTLFLINFHDDFFKDFNE